MTADAGYAHDGSDEMENSLHIFYRNDLSVVIPLLSPLRSPKDSSTDKPGGALESVKALDSFLMPFRPGEKVTDEFPTLEVMQQILSIIFRF